jgi:hypothetical protein
MSLKSNFKVCSHDGTPFMYKKTGLFLSHINICLFYLFFFFFDRVRIDEMNGSILLLSSNE